MTLLKALAARFGIPADETEIQKAVMMALEEGATSKTTLEQLIELLGKKPLEKARELVALKDLIPHIEGLLDGQVKSETESVDEDVEAVTAAYGLDPAFKVALRLQRCGKVAELSLDGCMQIENGKTPLELRRDAREAFVAQYPAAFQKPTDPAHLQMSLATTPQQPHSPILRAIGGGQGGAPTFARPQLPTSHQAPPALPAPAPGQGGNALELARAIDAFPGRNAQEKAMNYLRAQPGGDKLHKDKLHSDACLLVRKVRGAA